MFRAVVFCLALGHALGELPYILVNDSIDLSSMPYIIQGETAEDGKYPYQVSLFAGSGASKFHQCGASILTKTWLMTAAHCCAAGGYSALVGTNSLSMGGKIHATYNYKIHPQYSPSNKWRNDICLLRANPPIQFNDRVKQVVLPPQGKELKEGEFLTVTGWGYTTPDGRRAPDKLQVGKNYKFLPLNKCGPLTNITMFDGYLCIMANREGQGICQGDSGGPIAKDGVQYGIASFIFMPCGNPLPNFFARVANYVDWIKQTLGPDASELKIASS